MIKGIQLLTMNSRRPNPTPVFGMKLSSSARSGFATFIMIFVFVYVKSLPSLTQSSRTRINLLKPLLTMFVKIKFEIFYFKKRKEYAGN